MDRVDNRSAHARRLASALEPFAAQVYFSPECHAAYAGLGFGPSAGDTNGVAMPDGAAYFCSRGSVLGHVPGEVVASTFAVFNPGAVIPAVAFGWSLTDAATIGAARTDGALGQLRRILGEHPAGVERASSLLEKAGSRLRPEGRPLYAGVLSQDVPSDPLGAAWRFADRLREFRGDAHTSAWTIAGFDAVEIGLLTELYWGLPLRTYIRTRAWSAADMDAAEQRLDERGLTANGAFTDTGRAAREDVEVTTDRLCFPILDALGGDLDELLATLEPWGVAICDAHGYPSSGPHDLAALGSSHSRR